MEKFLPPFQKLRSVRNAHANDMLSLIDVAGLDPAEDLKGMNLRGVTWEPGEVAQIDTENTLLGDPIFLDEPHFREGVQGHAVHSLRVAGDVSNDFEDIAYSYHAASSIAAESSIETNIEKRREARKHLLNIIDRGMTGVVDPNTLFNSAVTASRLDLDQEAILLATLCEQYKPTASHRMLVLDLQSALGVGFEIVDEEFIRKKQDPQAVRDAAITASLVEVLMCPREQCEIIYSRASNIANRNREAGGISRLIDAIEASKDEVARRKMIFNLGHKANNDTVGALTSYAHVTLSQLHAMRSDPGWEQAYNDEVSAAIRLLKRESPIATWYDSSIRELRQFGSRIGSEAKIIDIANELSFDLESAQPVRTDNIQQQLLEMLKRVQAS